MVPIHSVEMRSPDMAMSMQRSRFYSAPNSDIASVICLDQGGKRNSLNALVIIEKVTLIETL